MQHALGIYQLVNITNKIQTEVITKTKIESKLIPQNGTNQSYIATTNIRHSICKYMEEFIKKNIH